MRRRPRARLVVGGMLLGLISTLLFPVGPAYADSIRSQQWYLSFLNVAQAHRYSDGAGITVAVVDSGVDAMHPDLAGSVLPGVALFPGATGDGTTDTNGHGTRMAGLIAGHGHGPDGGLGVLGIAPQAIILPVRESEGEIGAAVIQGIEWATAHGAKVISLSLADARDDPRERRAIDDAIGHDIVVVAGVGNTPALPPQYPAAYPGVLAVAGVDASGNHGSFSTVGPQAMIAAPGGDILTTGLNHGYGVSSGTSDSTAIVAGAAALVRAKFPNLPAVEVIHRLTATAIDKGPPGRDSEYGYGIVNLVEALTADVPPLTASPSGSPTVQRSAAAHGAGAPTRVWLLAGLAVLVVLATGTVIVAMRRAGS